ncbi:hypothetical protein BGZ65_012001 [Modicella reniformis]|uniref:Uncharacterized protein n=1 Tax=Modicella reniformis TaxID=1440133 RepID=A0A9P6IMC6_9FUNG|nr:hypothetical protein BGZ65_012001 [Modicella reniformis]
MMKAVQITLDQFKANYVQGNTPCTPTEFARRAQLRKKVDVQGAYLGIAKLAKDSDQDLYKSMKELWYSSDEQEALIAYLQSLRSQIPVKRRRSKRAKSIKNLRDEVPQITASDDGSFIDNVKKTFIMIRSNIEGPGELESATTESCIVENVNVTKKLMEERDANIEVQSDLETTDDLFSFEAEFKKIKLEWDHPMSSVLACLTASDDLWTWDQTKSSETTYQTTIVNPILLGFFKCVGVSRHFQTVPIGTTPDYQETLHPDFFGELEGLPVAVAEIKKPGESRVVIEQDRLKLFCTMKLGLNLLLQNNVHNPTIVGLLIQDDYCYVFTMKLEYEALYIPRRLSIGFGVPKSNGAIGSLLAALAPMSAVLDIVRVTVQSIKTRQRRRESSEMKKTRPSFYVRPSFIRQEVEEIEEDEEVQENEEA